MVRMVQIRRPHQILSQGLRVEDAVLGALVVLALVDSEVST